MSVDVIILHPLPGPGAGPLERALGAARAALAVRHRAGFLAAGATAATVVEGRPDGHPFGARLRAIAAMLPAGRGLVLLGSGAIPLATAADRRSFVEAASAAGIGGLANNRYSADVLALTAEAAVRLGDVPVELPGDNALPRWLAEVAGVPVGDLRRRAALGVDLDSPLDLVLVARVGDGSQAVRTAAASLPGAARVEAALDGVQAVLADRRAEFVVAGRTSASTLAWLEGHARCRVRAIVEERGLRASSRLALGAGGEPGRPPASLLGTVLDRDGPATLGRLLAGLGDAALVDSRVLLAHRLGADETGWPGAEDRFASDLLRSDAVADPWLRALTASAAGASIPVVLGGHTLVGPGVRLLIRRGRDADGSGGR